MLYPNVKFGAVIVSEAWHPYVPLTDPTKRAPDPLPVSNFSDFLYLIWKKVCDGDDECIKGFNGMIVTKVWSKVTIDVANQILGERDLLPWPGESFNMKQESGQVLAGTPNSYGLIYSLMQHEEWEDKRIHSITLFKDKNGDMCMFTVLEDKDGSTPPFAGEE